MVDSKWKALGKAALQFFVYHFDSYGRGPSNSPCPKECLLLSATRLGSITASIVNATCQEVIHLTEKGSDPMNATQPQTATISYALEVSDVSGIPL